MERPADRDIRIDSLMDHMGSVIIGKQDIIELVITALLADGHVLIEDVPGVGKTQLASALARSCGGTFGRIQLTPDVMPTDITGFSMINMATHEMEFKKGAVFCNFLLADEINRASPKSQSALLETMEERQVSIDGMTYPMEEPFMVLATQNPVETYGTYHLPEAQMDRFLMRLTMGYPGRENELAILNRRNGRSAKKLTPVISCQDILELREEVEKVQCQKKLEEYIVDISEATRHADYISLGASPRASIALYRSARAYAFVCGRNYVLPDDIKKLAPVVLAHRIILTSRGRAAVGNETEAVKQILKNVQVPV